MPKHIVAKVSDVGPGQRILVNVAGRPIAIFNIDGEFFAVLNRCPHQGAPLYHGQLTGVITSPEPGTYECSRFGEILRCPWHGWEFRIRTGESWFDPATTKMRTYETSVAPGDELVHEPLKADVFPVSADDDYIVVDV